MIDKDIEMIEKSINRLFKPNSKAVVMKGEMPHIVNIMREINELKKLKCMIPNEIDLTNVIGGFLASLGKEHVTFF